MAKTRAERHYVWAIRLAMVGFAALGAWIALAADHLLALLQFAITVKSASGLALLLRWFWWRVNVWADLSAQVLSLPVTFFYVHGERIFGAGSDPVTRLTRWCGATSADDRFAAVFLLSVGTTTLLWLAVMWLTPAEPEKKLQDFFRRVRPYGAWGRIAATCPGVRSPDRMGEDALLYALRLTVSVGLLFGVGHAIFGVWWPAAGCFALALAAAVVLVRQINRRFAPGATDRGV